MKREKVLKKRKDFNSEMNGKRSQVGNILNSKTINWKIILMIFLVIVGFLGGFVLSSIMEEYVTFPTGFFCSNKHSVNLYDVDFKNASITDFYLTKEAREELLSMYKKYAPNEMISCGVVYKNESIFVIERIEEPDYFISSPYAIRGRCLGNKGNVIVIHSHPLMEKLGVECRPSSTDLLINKTEMIVCGNETVPKEIIIFNKNGEKITIWKSEW